MQTRSSKLQHGTARICCTLLRFPRQVIYSIICMHDPLGQLQACIVTRHLPICHRSTCCPTKTAKEDYKVTGVPYFFSIFPSKRNHTLSAWPTQTLRTPFGVLFFLFFLFFYFFYISSIDLSLQSIINLLFEGSKPERKKKLSSSSNISLQITTVLTPYQGYRSSAGP